MKLQEKFKSKRLSSGEARKVQGEWPHIQEGCFGEGFPSGNPDGATGYSDASCTNCLNWCKAQHPAPGGHSLIVAHSGYRMKHFLAPHHDIWTDCYCFHHDWWGWF